MIKPYELVVMCGIPGSGKSTYVKNNLEASHIVVCADDYRKAYTGKDFHQPAEHTVYTMVKTTVEVMLRRDKDVVIDMTSLTVKDRRKWIELAGKCMVVPRCVWMDMNFETCLRRNLRRDRRVPEDVIHAMEKRFVPPTKEEGFVEIMRVTDHG